jgi:D-sedoheptulose 7-phosphate isomerase
LNTFSKTYIQDLIKVLDLFPHDKFEQMVDTLIEAYNEDRNIFVMGNGGSGSTASHWACDVNKGCSFGKFKKFKMLCLNDNISTILAYANDLSYDFIFVEQLKNFFRFKDVVIGISGSGNSVNVLNAIKYAKKNGGITVGLCGFDGGKLHDLVDVAILVEINDMQKVEDTHVIIAHMAMQKICEKLGQFWPEVISLKAY